MCLFTHAASSSWHFMSWYGSRKFVVGITSNTETDRFVSSDSAVEWFIPGPFEAKYFDNNFHIQELCIQ